MIVRGGMDLPVVIGGVTLPKTAKLSLQRFEGKVDPLGWMSIASVPQVSGQTANWTNCYLGAGFANFIF
jgi:hypothetical protein